MESLIRNISGGVGRKIRYYYYKNRLGYCGKNVNIDIGVIIDNPSHIYLHENVWIDNYAILIGGYNKNSFINITYIKNVNFEFNYGDIIIMENTHIGPNVIIQGHGGVYVGKNLTIAAGSKIYSLTNYYKNLNTGSTKDIFFSPLTLPQNQYYILSPVYIGDGSAVAIGCNILPGTSIPTGTWVGAGLTISGQLEKDSIYINKCERTIKHK